MPRFRNRATGSTISVSDDYAARLSGREWEPLDTPPRKSTATEPAVPEPENQRGPEPAPAEPTPAKKIPAKKKAPAKRRKGGDGG